MAPRKWGIYFLWISRYVFDKDISFIEDKDKEVPLTEKIITIRSKNQETDFKALPNSKLIVSVNNTARHYDYKEYPSSNMRYNDIGEADIRANY